MNDAEKALLKKFAHEFADSFLPELVDIEAGKIPPPYDAIAKLVLAGIKPQLQAFLDAKIDAM